MGELYPGDGERRHGLAGLMGIGETPGESAVEDDGAAEALLRYNAEDKSENMRDI